MIPEDLGGESYVDAQKAINTYAQDADKIAETFAPFNSEERKLFTVKEMEQKLKDLGFDDNYGKTLLFSTVNKNYRISLVTEVAGVKARLEALYQVARHADSRIGSSPTVHWVTLQ